MTHTTKTPPCPNRVAEDRLRRAGSMMLGAITAMLVLGVFAVVIFNYVSIGHTSRAHYISAEESFYLAQAGLEFAHRKILEEGAAPAAIAGTYTLGPGTLSVAEGAGGKVVVSGRRVQATATYAASISTEPPNMADELNVDTSGAVMADNDRRLQGIFVSMIPAATLPFVVITHLRLTWTPNNNRRTQDVTLGGVTDRVNAANGVLMDITDHRIDATDPAIELIFDFNNNNSGRTFTIEFHMSDGSIYTTSAFAP